MPTHPTIAAIILTKDEAMHIERCINSLKGVCSEIFVVDSFSSDETITIAQQMGARCVTHPFEYQAKQFNWCINNCDIQADWIWRIDADEYISDDLGKKVRQAIQTAPPDVNGIYVNKVIVFQGRKLKHGGWYPAPQIKIIRNGYGQSEDKVMDEHLVITSGKTIYVDGDQTDENLNDLTWWTDKHNKYTNREAVNMLRMLYGLDSDGDAVRPKILGNNAERKRWLKLRYVKMPLFLRPFANFTYRYFFKLGFLDGKEGFVWHVLQGFWYRFLVDAKIFEIKKKFNFDDDKIKQYIKDNYFTPPQKLS